MSGHGVADPNVIPAPGALTDVNLIQYLGVACSPDNPVDVEDTGLNTNPRRYEKDNGFYSLVVARALGATALWTIATLPARTAGQVTTIYTLEIENSTGAAVTGWLEIGGAPITVPIHVANNDSVVINYVAGLNSGDADVDCNGGLKMSVELICEVCGSRAHTFLGNGGGN
jgi:hypothetical protein